MGKRSKGMAKGSSFEREVCGLLSRWWTNGQLDDVFWRTAGSGSRATQRNKRGARTFGQSADVEATDPIGQPLIDCFAIEIKRGYNTATLSNYLDSAPKAKPEFLQFIQQADRSAKQYGAIYWLLIHKRDRRIITATLPYAAFRQLRQQSRSRQRIMRMQTPQENTDSAIIISYDVAQLPLSGFFQLIRPQAIIELVEAHK